ncbi:MAG TPA: PIG-L deacetylase family protein [Chloroflexota bacterium]|nr:PIG-L deacetylase family protein [Chloroflexota bacterium]
MADEETYEPRRVMVVVAHPDDAEFMAAGTVAKWAKDGKEIVYVLCTNGDKGTSDKTLSPAALAEARAKEQQAAAARLGVREVVFLGYEDGILQNTLELRRDIVRQIRRFKPEVVVCQDPTTRWSGQYINHPDHRAAGDATLDSIYPSARDPHVFPELLAEGLEPHKVREVYVGGTNQADVWVDIGDTIDLKIQALLAHESQIHNGTRPADWDIGKVVRERAEQVADGHDMQFAEAFKYFKLR